MFQNPKISRMISPIFFPFFYSFFSLKSLVFQISILNYPQKTSLMNRFRTFRLSVAFQWTSLAAYALKQETANKKLWKEEAKMH